MISILFLIKTALSLSWVCDYPCGNKCSRISNCISGPGDKFFLYKEDNLAQVKWIEKVEYCRAKGDVSVYTDAGQGKCEYSRGICVWNNNECKLNSNRGNDPYYECKDLLINNELVDGLDNGRKKLM